MLILMMVVVLLVLLLLFGGMGVADQSSGRSKTGYSGQTVGKLATVGFGTVGHACICTACLIEKGIDHVELEQRRTQLASQNCRGGELRGAPKCRRVDGDGPCRDDEAGGGAPHDPLRFQQVHVVPWNAQMRTLHA
jgi:hypothetical protein